MDKFKFIFYSPSWPDWFNDLIEQEKVQVTIGTDPAHEDDDNWQDYDINVAYLWTPNKVIVAYEGDTIVNRDGYCELEKYVL